MTEKSEMLTHPDSKYRMILVAARRSKQIQKGNPAKVALPNGPHKATRLALEEVKRGLIPFEILPPREIEEDEEV